MQLLFWLLVLCALCANGENTCVPYDPSQLVSPCDVYAPSRFALLTNGSSLQELIDYTNAVVANTQAITTTAPPECIPYINAWFCQNPSLFTGVLPLQNCPATEFAVAIPTCKDLCVRFRALCIKSFEAVGIQDLLPPTYCDAYSNDGLSLDGLVYPCWNITPEANPPRVNFTCPPDTVQVDVSCDLVCPSPAYTSEQIFQLGLMQQIVGWISLVVTLLVLALTLVWRSLWLFPMRLMLYLMISTVPLSLAFILATFVGGDVGDVWCGSVASFREEQIGGADRMINNDGLCAFQGWNIMLGTLLVAFWWATLAFNTALIIFKARMKLSNVSPRMEIVYLLICWPVPLALTVIAIAAGEIGYESTDTFCFVGTENDQAWRIALWFVPIGLALVFGTVCTVVSIVSFVHLKYQTASSLGKMEQSVIVRMLVVMGIVTASLVIVFASQIFSSAQLSNNQTWLLGYYFDLSIGESRAEARQSLNDNTQLVTQYRLNMTATFFMAVVGLFCSAFFMSSRMVRHQLSASMFTWRSSSSEKSPSARTAATTQHANTATSTV